MSRAEPNYLIGRGAQIDPHNPFHKNEYFNEHWEGIDVEPELKNPKTRYFIENAKKIVNKVISPDVPMMQSMNPYQGCEHGCIYCYARNTHQYWGLSAGLEFESKIIIKPNAPELLERHFRKRNYQVEPIMLSGNTDCYQPIERKLEITKRILQVFLKYKHPVGIITKNYMVLRDLKILKKLAEHNLVSVSMSITTLKKDLHLKMEPRTAAPFKRMKVVRELSAHGIPVNVMMAPIIPGLNDGEIPKLIERAAKNGASSIHYTMVRLNGAVKEIFTDWVKKSYPRKADKILSKISECHGGKVSDSRFKTRMSGEGNVAKMINDLFNISRSRYFDEAPPFEFNTTAFRPPPEGQLDLF